MSSPSPTMCECEGWWEQDGFGRQPMEQLRLSFAARRIAGTGCDMIGLFTLTGSVDEHGAATIVKQYIGQHSVAYFGLYDGEGTISGEWRIGPSGGRWSITIRRARVDGTAEIREIEPA